MKGIPTIVKRFRTAENARSDRMHIVRRVNHILQNCVRLCSPRANCLRGLALGIACSLLWVSATAQVGTTWRVSVASDGTQANDSSGSPDYNHPLDYPSVQMVGMLRLDLGHQTWYQRIRIGIQMCLFTTV